MKSEKILNEIKINFLLYFKNISQKFEFFNLIKNDQIFISILNFILSEILKTSLKLI
jgi:hypothetical protein